MSGGDRVMCDCAYCGRTKFADETLSCCIDEEYEKLSPEGKLQVDGAMRNYARRERKERFGRHAGDNPGNSEGFDCCTGKWGEESLL